MRRISLAATLTVVFSLIGTSSALAWNSHGDFLSCGEADFSGVTAEQGWKLTQITDGVVTKTKVFDVVKAGNVSWPVFATLGSHYVSVTLANAKNPHDGYSEVHSTFIDCVASSSSGSPGPPGPAGPPGKDGVGYDCTGTAVPTGGTPAMCPGTPGTTTTIIVHEAPKVCTSNRKYAFKVRRYYPGAGGATSQKVVGATASEPGIADVKVTKTKTGRFLVTWSTTGQKFVAGGTVKTMNIRASLVSRVLAGHSKSGKPIYKTAVNPRGPKHIRLVWKYRPCTPKDGNLNDPSAAGQGATGGA